MRCNRHNKEDCPSEFCKFTDTKYTGSNDINNNLIVDIATSVCDVIIDSSSSCDSSSFDCGSFD